MKHRARVRCLIALAITAALATIATPARADGGDFSIDFVAAGPFTYDHGSGAGGEYADRTISKTDGVVESLEGDDFACDDKVVYFAAITVDEGATEEQDIELTFGFLAEPTGQPGVGHSDLVSASPNSDDSGMSGETGDTDVSILSEDIDTSGSADTLVATIEVEGLDPGEVFILRLVSELSCIHDSDPTGNLQSEIQAGIVVDPEEDSIKVGNQTIPFKVRGIRFETGVRVEKTCPPSASAGDTITYVITVINTGSEPLKGIKVLDSVLGDLSGSFADTLAVDESETQSFTHRVDGDPDPLVNTVTVKTEGSVTDESVSDTESCETDVVVPPVTPPTVLPEVEVLPRTFLPETGVNLPGLSAAGLAFLLLGFALVAASRRPAVSHAGMATGSMIVRRLRGRAGYVLPRWFLLGFARIEHRRRRSSDRIQRIRRTGAGRT